MADLVKLIQIRNKQILTAAEASVAINGSDFSGASTDPVITFDLYLSADGVNTLNASASHISGIQFTLGVDASQLDNVSAFASSVDLSWMMEVVVEGGLFQVSSLNNVNGVVSLGNPSAVVDIDGSNDTGRDAILLEQKVATLYLNPKDSSEGDGLQLTVKDMEVVTNSGAVYPEDYLYSLGNNAPSGSVSITGVTKVGQTLTAANTLVDTDGLGTISYQWTQDGTDISGATNDNYVLTDSDIGSTFTVTASYTDDGGTLETSTSVVSDAVTDIVKLIQIRDVRSLTASEASVAINGSDYSTDPDDKVVKFDLYLNAEGLDTLADSATDILGAEFTLNFDASQLGSVSDFSSSGALDDLMEVDLDSGIFMISLINNETGVVVVGNPYPVVDIDLSNDSGRNKILAEQKIATVYLNPDSELDQLQLSVQGMNITTDGSTVQPLNYSLDLDLNNAPVVVTEIADMAADERVAFSYDASTHFNDVDSADGASYTVSDNPVWLSMDAGTGILSGTPGSDAIGSTAVTVSRTDTAGDSASDTFTLTVANVNDAPTVDSTITGVTVNESALCSVDISGYFTDVDGDALIYSLNTSDETLLPTWISIDSSTGIISGTPSASDIDVLSLSVTATDGGSLSVSTPLSLRVNDIPDVINAIADASTNEDALYSYNVASHFNDNDDLTYSASEVNGAGETVPLDGFSINTLTGELSGTPDNNKVGSMTIRATATDSFGVSISDDYVLQIVNTNDAPTGAVTVSGIVEQSRTLTVVNDLVDDDGLGALNYQWSKGGTDIVGATQSTYMLTSTDVGAQVMATVSYTDGGGTVESVDSHATAAVVDVIKLLQLREASIITASQAAIEINGSDRSGGSSDDVAKFDIFLDAEGLDTLEDNATEIRGIDFTLGFESSGLDSVSAFASEANEAWWMDLVLSTGFFDITAANNATGNFAIAKSTGIVDIISGNDVDGGALLEHKVGTVYLNPKAAFESLQLTVKEMVVATDTGNVTPLDYSVSLAAPVDLIDAVIKVDGSHYLNNASIKYFTENNADTGVVTEVKDNGVKVGQKVTFETVKLSDSAVFTPDIQINDAIDILRHIVNIKPLASGSHQFHAADIDNSGGVDISDAIDILRHIVGIKPIDSFDLINESGARVTEVDPDATGDTPTWTLVANGDVDLSGTFPSDYTVAVDLV